jgi:hypothetical protein
MDKIYDEYEIDWKINENTRDKIRREVVNKFLSEPCGYWLNGIKHVTRFKYFVEKCEDNRRIYLLRPTFLNKGIDFQVWVEKIDGVHDKRPSHRDIFEDLKIKKQESPRDFPRVMQLINKVWECKEPDSVLEAKDKTYFQKGFPIDMLLKILKWLFIEQDLTYWNYDGRQMLKTEINKLNDNQKT